VVQNGAVRPDRKQGTTRCVKPHGTGPNAVRHAQRDASKPMQKELDTNNIKGLAINDPRVIN